MTHARSFAIVALLSAMLGTAAGAPLQTVTVAMAAAQGSHSAEGFVEAVRQSTIAAQVPARITEIRVRAGDVVKAGQLLVRLDARTATDQLAASQAQVAAAQAQLDTARKDFERSRRLFEKRYISQAALDQAEAQFKSAEAQARSTKAQAGVASTQTSFATLVAPYSGVIATVNAELGDMASPGVPLLTIYDPTELRVVAQLPESYTRHLASDQPVRITLAGGSDGPRIVEATRMVLLPTADPTTHTRLVRLTLPAGTPGLAPGLFARASFPLAQAETTHITVPTRALVRRPEFSAVYVIDANGRAQLRQVRPGRESGDSVEILAGLRAGDRIALDPVAAANQ